MSEEISMMPATSAGTSAHTVADGAAAEPGDAVASTSPGGITHRQLRIGGLRVHVEICGEG